MRERARGCKTKSRIEKRRPRSLSLTTESVEMNSRPILRSWCGATAEYPSLKPHRGSETKETDMGAVQDNDLGRRELCLRLLGMLALTGLAGCGESEATRTSESEAHAKAEIEARIKAYGPSGSPYPQARHRVVRR
jgi:hypothetical protein